MKIQKDQRGITLVALVVTIIVLLILAGVTIMYVMSDNGIFGKAQTAKENTNVAVVQEVVMNAILEAQTEFYDPSSTVVTDEATANTLINKRIKEAGITGTVTLTAFSDETNGTVGSGSATYNGTSYTITINSADTDGKIVKVEKTTTP